MTARHEVLAPNSDDLLRAAGWLEEQADEADSVAAVFSGGRSSTIEAKLTRQTAAWLRSMAGCFPITITFPDEYVADSGGPCGYASVLLAELKGAIEYGDLSASTPVNITVNGRTPGGNVATLLDREWTDTGVSYGPNPAIFLSHHLEPENEEDLLRKLLILWAMRSEDHRRLAGPLLAQLDSRVKGGSETVGH